MVVSSDLVALQSYAERVRNICILAHVDHGKTTFSDSLISSNGIISSKLAGEIRYLDSREDEQLRCITMKSSSISLLHNFQVEGATPSSSKSACDAGPYLVNLIDSPGHIDFTSEVSTAVRVSDGALLLVDVTEGVCIQTQAVMRQAFSEKVHPFVVLNKLDRLITELRLTPEEGYMHCRAILEEVNAYWATLHQAEVVASTGMNDNRPRAYSTSSQGAAEVEASNTGLELEELDPDIVFSPELGNVLFTSAVDGWAFSVRDFASMYAKKLGIRQELLERTMWGEYFFDAKNRKVTKSNPKGKLKHVFVQFAFQNIWQVYDTAIINADDSDRSVKLEKIVKSLALDVSQRELTHKDPRMVLRSICMKWLPISRSALNMVVTSLPSPKEAQSYRLPPIWRNAASPPVGPKELFDGGLNCDRETSTVAYVSKMFSVPLQYLPRRPVDATEGSDEAFVAFTRVYSGTLRGGDKVYVIHPRYAPGKESDYTEVVLDQLMIMMGRDFIQVEEAPAGSIVGITGLGRDILKSATISSSLDSYPIAPMQFEAAPIVAVALETPSASDMPKLIEGLQLLNQADPAVDVHVRESGEHILGACGEVHLERCLKDLREVFAKVPEIVVSPPLVSLKETVTAPRNECGAVQVSTSSGLYTFTIRAVPLPDDIVKLITNNQERMRQMLDALEDNRESSTNNREVPFLSELKTAFSEAGSQWEEEFGNIWSFGPKRVGGNLLIQRIEGYDAKTGWSSCLGHGVTANSAPLEDKFLALQEMENSIVTGFQMASAGGPLCEEPVVGVCFVLEDFVIEEGVASDDASPYQAMTALRDGCRDAILQASPRLVEPMYQCEVHATSEAIGKVHGVLAKRRSRVQSEDMKEGTSMFILSAYMPVLESFGFADDLRKRASGGASPQLMFSHWQIIEQDPFFVPKTEDELEEFGADDVGNTLNVAKVIVKNVRKRKGLLVDEKVIVRAEKQRTLTRNK